MNFGLQRAVERELYRTTQKGRDLQVIVDPAIDYMHGQYSAEMMQVAVRASVALRVAICRLWGLGLQREMGEQGTTRTAS